MMKPHLFQKFLPKRLRAQVGLIVSLLLAATLGLYAWHMSRVQGDNITAAAGNQASVIAKSIANLSIPYVLTEDYASIETLLVKMAELPAVLSLSVCDAEGDIYSRVLHDEHAAPTVSYSGGRLEPPGDSRPLLTTVRNGRITAWHPIFEGSLLGWVRIEYSLHVVDDLRRDIWRDAFISGFAAVTAGIFLILLFLNRHIKAVGYITDFAKKLDERKGGTIYARDGSLETEQLVSALNQTSQRLYEQDRSLKESEKKYRTLFEESKDVIFFNTLDGKFIDINNAGVELFGFDSKEELFRVDIGNDLYINPPDRMEFIKEMRKQGFIKDYELRLKRKNGDGLIVLITATPVYDEAGGLSSYRGILRDVTSERKLEEQLRHAQKMEAVGQLTGGIAHDFNNIITAIIGFAYVLQSKLDGNEVLRSHAETILAAAEKAANLTQGLLMFSSKQASNPRPIAVNDIVGRLKKLLSKLLGEDVELNINPAPDNPIIMADSGQMDQVLMNLAANARDAMLPAGILTIETRSVKIDAAFIAAHGFGKPGDYVLLSVADTGSGMDADTVKRIFEPFFTTKEVGKGTGLGLSVVYGIIKQHDGYINTYSEPGKGTKFNIYLPAIQAEAAPQPGPEPVTEPGGTETILLAEDDRDLRKLTRTVLGESGYNLIEAVDGEDAIAKFIDHSDRINLLLLDVTMPRKNGKQVYDEIRKRRPDIKVLFISAHTEEILRKKGLLQENTDFISKPVTPSRLLKKIREVLDKPGRRVLP